MDEIAKLKKQIECKDKEILALRKALDIRIRASAGSTFPHLHATLAPSVEATIEFEKRYSEDPRYKISRKKSKPVMMNDSSRSNPTTKPPKLPSRPRHLRSRLTEEECSDDYVDKSKEFENFKTLTSSLTLILVKLTEFRGTLEVTQSINQSLSDAMKCENELRSCPALRTKILPMLKYLRWFRTCLEELNTAQNILNLSLLHGIEKPLREFLNSKMIPLSRLRRDLDRTRSAYQNATSKFLRTRNGDNEKIKTRVSASINARRTYEMKRLDSAIAIEHVLEHLNGNLSENFLSALYALLVYFGHTVSHTEHFHEKVKRALDNLYMIIFFIIIFHTHNRKQQQTEAHVSRTTQKWNEQGEMQNVGHLLRTSFELIAHHRLL